MKKAEFGQKYFYIFGLNLKFCRGIRRYQEQLSEAEYNHQKGLRTGNDGSGSSLIKISIIFFSVPAAFSRMACNKLFKGCRATYLEYYSRSIK